MHAILHESSDHNATILFCKGNQGKSKLICLEMTRLIYLETVSYKSSQRCFY